MCDNLITLITLQCVFDFSIVAFVAFVGFIFYKITKFVDNLQHKNPLTDLFSFGNAGFKNSVDKNNEPNYTSELAQRLFSFDTEGNTLLQKQTSNSDDSTQPAADQKPSVEPLRKRRGSRVRTPDSQNLFKTLSAISVDLLNQQLEKKKELNN